MISSLLTAVPCLMAQAAQTPAPWQKMVANFLPFVLLFVVLYFLWIRPEQKRSREHRELIQKIKAGDRIVTSAGIYGTVTEVKDKTLLVRVASGVDIELDRAAIGRVEKVA